MKHSEVFKKLFDPFEIERMRQITTKKTTISQPTVSETQSKYRDDRTGYPEQQPVYNNIEQTPSNIVNVIDYLPTYHKDGTLLTVDEIINNVKKYFDHK